MGLGQGGLIVSNVIGYNYADPQIEAFHKTHPTLPVFGDGECQRCGDARERTPLMRHMVL